MENQPKGTNIERLSALMARIIGERSPSEEIARELIRNLTPRSVVNFLLQSRGASEDRPSRGRPW